MRARCLREVNLPDGRSREDQAHECIAKNSGDLANGLIERSIAIAHERSPCPRSPKASCAVQNDHPRRSPLRGRNAVWWKVSTQRSAVSVNYIRGPVSERPAWGWTTRAMVLTNSWFGPENGRKRLGRGISGRGIGAPTGKRETNGRDPERAKPRPDGDLEAALRRQQTAGESLRGNELAPQVGLEPTTLRLTAECSTIELLRSSAISIFL